MADVIDNQNTLDTSDTPIVNNDEPIEQDGKMLKKLSINLITEIGNGLPNANCYTTLEFADNYFRDRGNTEWLSMDDEEKKKCLIVANDFVDTFYKWRGNKRTEQQALSFPRVDLVDNDGFSVTGIPYRLKRAICEAALLVKGKTSLFFTKDVNGDIHTKKVDVLEVSYFQKRSSKYSSTFESIYDILNSILDGLYKTDADKSTYNVDARWLGL